MVRDSVKATAPHIAILGHITPEAFRAKMQDSEMAGGTYNRFLPIFCHRNLILPESPGAAPELIESLAQGWRSVLVDAQKVDEVRLGEPPKHIATALDWITKKSLPIAELDESQRVRAALEALSTRLDGKTAAANTIKNRRMVFNNTLRYAIERKLLPSNPLQFVDWAPPETDDEIDLRYVPNPQQAKTLISAVGTLGPRGKHLQAFFGCGYYAATRPAEAMNLRMSDCTLPEAGWGVLLLSGSSPRVGSAWTDDGRSYEERGLKRRARSATRDVPIPPGLVRLLRDHLARYGAGPDGRLFRAARGGVLLSKEYPEVWNEARKVALTKKQAATPLVAVPYSLRHAGVSLWLASGVDPTEVARRAGHSVAVLYRFYAKVLDGKRDQANERIERALREAE